MSFRCQTPAQRVNNYYSRNKANDWSVGKQDLPNLNSSLRQLGMFGHPENFMCHFSNLVCVYIVDISIHAKLMSSYMLDAVAT